MKLFLYFICIISLLFIGQESVNAMDYANWSNVNSETSFTSALDNGSKASLSSDLNVSYEQQPDSLTEAKGFLASNWDNILFALLGLSEIVTRLVPSIKDNSIFNFFMRIINVVVPNVNKNGGTF